MPYGFPKETDEPLDIGQGILVCLEKQKHDNPDTRQALRMLYTFQHI